MTNRVLYAGMLALLVPVSACVAGEAGPDRAPQDEHVGSAGLPVLSGNYTANPNIRSSGFPLGVCGYGSNNDTNNRELNDNNSPYVLNWVSGNKMCMTLTLRSTDISSSCANSDGNVAGEIDYGARCVSQGTSLRKIAMPIKWGLVDTSTYDPTNNPNSTPCLTQNQSSLLTASGSLVQIGTVNATWPGHTTPLGVGYWKIFRHDSGTTPKYQYDIVAYGSSSTGSFLATIKGADASKADLNNVTLCLVDSGGHQMPASYDATDCVGFWQSESISWYPTYAPYGFYDVTDHSWCPVSYGAWP